MLSYDRSFLYGANLERWRDRVDGDQANFDLDDVSPSVQVARLTRPLLLAHGAEDRRVPIEQHRTMLSRASDAGVTVQSLELEESGHGFDSPEDEQAWLDALVNFLTEHNRAD